MNNEYSKSQLEDKALKSASMYFGRELLPYFNIGKKILQLLPTEQIRLEAVRATEDMLFEMEDGTLAHFEFESIEITKDDLRRFRSYDAYTGMIYRKPVTTYVICSGNIKKIHSILDDGTNTYRIIPLQMKKENSDILITNLKTKAGKGRLTKGDIVPLLLAPLMSGKSSIKDRILEAEEIINAESGTLGREDKQHMEAVLYTFACKFLERAELNEIKEAFSMTVLGEMIWSDGEKIGIEKGIQALILDNLEEGILKERILEKLKNRFELTENQAENYFIKYADSKGNPHRR